MHRKQPDLRGNIQIIQEITRTQAARELQPPVSTRTIQKYIEVAALFLDSFTEFQDPETGYLNRFAKLNTWHLPKLQRIREYVRHKGFQQLQIELSRNPQYFETGVSTNDSHTSRSILQNFSKEVA